MSWWGAWLISCPWFIFPGARVVVICYLCELSLCMDTNELVNSILCVKIWDNEKRYTRQLSGNTTKLHCKCYYSCMFYPLQQSQGGPSCTAFNIKVEQSSTFRYFGCSFLLPVSPKSRSFDGFVIKVWNYCLQNVLQLQYSTFQGEGGCLYFNLSYACGSCLFLYRDTLVFTNTQH